MKIDLHSLFHREAQQDKIDKARKSIEESDALQQMLRTPGWAILSKHIHEVLDNADRVSTCDEQEFNIRKGYVNGLNEPLSYIERLKTSAQSAMKYLDSVDNKGV